LIRVRNNFAVRIGDIFLRGFTGKGTTLEDKKEFMKRCKPGFCWAHRRCDYRQLKKAAESSAELLAGQQELEAGFQRHLIG